MNKKNVKFKIKDGYPKLSLIYNHKKYILSKLDELPKDAYDYAIKQGIYGIEPVKEKKDGIEPVKEKKNVIEPVKGKKKEDKDGNLERK